jgi:hypothetical protein
METITLEIRNQRIAVATRPITRQEFKAYLAAAGKPVSKPLARGDSPSAAVTYVSQADAIDYCRWLAAKEGRRYRLPTMSELNELADEVTQDGIDLEVWPHTYQMRSELRGGMKPTYLCEWTQETDEVPQYGTGTRARALGSVFYPPWVRQSGNASHAQAHLAATEGYSFVTFRVAYDVV